jgi:hypothetical protein
MPLSAQQLEELRRMARVSDMLTSMHAMLRDRFALRAILLDASLMLGSAVLGVFALAGFASLGAFSVNPDTARVVMAVASCVIFVASVVAYKVEWKARADEHSRAYSAYGRFKLRCRESLVGAEQLSDDEFHGLVHAYASLGEAHAAVPDAQFVALKAAHERKVFLSRCLSQRPFVSARLLAWVMWWRHTCAAVRDKTLHKPEEQKENPEEGKNPS